MLSTVMGAASTEAEELSWVSVTATPQHRPWWGGQTLVLPLTSCVTPGKDVALNLQMLE